MVREDFAIRALGGRGIDLVLSNAAFEHFDDVDDVIRQLGAVVVPGGALVSEVDLQTHTRWIRDADPLNIYRYAEPLYGAFRFRGSPNRVRPDAYRTALERHGWADIRGTPVVALDPDYVRQVQPTLAGSFREAPDMDVLRIMLCARRARPEPARAAPQT